MNEQQGHMNEQHASGDNGQHTIRFGNYDLVSRIDVGGMGEVYLARQRSAFGREVAVKIIRSDLVHDMLARRRFLREAEVSAHLKHEHILPLFEFGEEQGRLFLVTPYIEGGTLAYRLQSGPLAPPEVYQLFSALVQAVAYIHKRGVIHRDLKPSNILLDQESDTGQLYVRLIDFGIASIQGLMASPPLTNADNEMGTLAYLAPERFEGIAAPSNDIYSLGIILYEMLTGHLPTPDKVVRLPRSMEYIIHRCIAPDPDDRFASADELLQAFDQAYRSLSSILPHVTAPVPVPPLVEPASLEYDAPTPRHVTTSHPAVNTPFMPLENRSLQREAAIPPTPVRAFKTEDYNAPTTYIGPPKLQVKSQPDATPDLPPRVRKRPRRSLVGILSLLIVAILLGAAGIFFFAFQGAIFVSADISISPQQSTISSVFTLTTQMGLTSPNSATRVIPMYTLGPISGSKAEKGPTTGKPFLCVLNCPKAVSSDDVDALGTKAQQELNVQLTQQLKSELQGKKATMIGTPSFGDVNGSSNPTIGATSDTVTVTVTESATVRYISNADAQKVAGDLLQQMVDANHTLMQTQTGVPILKSVNAQGVATLQIAAAGIVRYRQLSSTELQAILTHVKGLKVKDANAFIAKQTGVDGNATHISVSSGDSIPNDVKEIHLKEVDPTSIPTIQLPPITANTTPGLVSGTPTR